MRKRLLPLALLLTAASPIKDDESLAVFPVYGVQSPDGAWRVKVHAWVYEQEPRSPARNAFLLALEAALPSVSFESPVFRERVRWFLRDSERGKKLHMRMGGLDVPLPPTGPNGHVQAEVVLSSAPAGPAAFTLDSPGVEARVFQGTVYLIPSEGLSIVSDIDDTVKVSEVRDRRRLLARTFVEPFAAVDGMADLYERWSARGAAFHYVSASPWQMGEALGNFLALKGFPRGTLHLKGFRFKDKTLFNLIAAPDEHKTQVLEELFRDFPRRRFILIGDDGERDPEIYAKAARAHPGRVQKILIRLAYDPADSPRFAETFKGLPADLWTLFKNPADLPAAD